MKKENIKKLLLGIDPGSRYMGFSIFNIVSNQNFHRTSSQPSINKPILIEYGLIESKYSKNMEILQNRIYYMAKSLIDMLKSSYQNHKFILTIEKYLFNRFHANGSTVIPMLHGAIIYHLMESELLDEDTNVIMIAPQTAKKTVTGDGRASKIEVKNAVIRLFKLDKSKIKRNDVYDAIAIGYSGLVKYLQG